MTALKFSALVIITIVYLCKSYYYDLTKSKYVMAWVSGLSLLVPFVLTTDLIIMFISLIGFSLAIYTFILSDYTNHSAREAGIKYFFLSAISAGLILFAITISYVMFNTFDYIAINHAITTNESTIVVQYMLACFIQGFAFKLAAYPGIFELQTCMRVHQTPL